MHMPSLRRNRQGTTSRPGVVSIEMAFALPLMMLILFASLEVSRANNLIHVSHLAAYEGARRGVVPGATAANVQATVASIMGVSGIRNSQVELDPAVLSDTTEFVGVRISIPISGNSYVAPLFFAGRTINSSMKMRRESLDPTVAP